MRALLAGLALVVPSMGWAQASRGPVERVQIILIDDGELIDGQAKQADLERVDTRPHASFSNLIRVRRDFDDKVRTSPLP